MVRSELVFFCRFIERGLHHESFVNEILKRCNMVAKIVERELAESLLGESPDKDYSKSEFSLANNQEHTLYFYEAPKTRFSSVPNTPKAGG